MTERELLELIAVQVGKLTQDVDLIKSTMATKAELEEIRNTMATKKDIEKIWATMDTMATKAEFETVKAIVLRIEHDHGEKLGALFDAYQVHSERLDRIEKIIARHEEILLGRHLS